LFPLFATGVIDTGGKFAASVVDTAGKFDTGINNTSETGGKIFRRLALIPVVHLYLRISLKIFEKILNGHNGILLGWGENDS
jgi:hypothetical protein